MSIYSVYALVTAELNSVIKTMDKAVGTALGIILACGEPENLKKTFKAYSTVNHIISTVAFSTATVLSR